MSVCVLLKVSGLTTLTLTVWWAIVTRGTVSGNCAGKKQHAHSVKLRFQEGNFRLSFMTLTHNGSCRGTGGCLINWICWFLEEESQVKNSIWRTGKELCPFKINKYNNIVHTRWFKPCKIQQQNKNAKKKKCLGITFTHTHFILLYQKAAGEHFKQWYKDNGSSFLEPQAAS